ncbi:MAG: PKD domain-containing protein [Bacteroidota bacterium]
MKNALFCLFFCSSSILCTAQVIFTANDLPQIGDTLFFAIDNDYLIDNLQDTGAGIIWDFTDLYPDDLALNIYFNPVETPFAENFQDANIALRIDFDEPSYSYFSQSDSLVNILGLTANIEEFGGVQQLQFIDPQLFTVLPTMLGTNITDTSTFQFEFLDPVFNQTFTLKSTTYSQINTDASGEVRIPGGTFPSLRQQVITERRDSLFTFIFGEERLIEPLVEFDTIYLWISPESKGIILSTDMNNNITYYAPDLADLQAPIAGFDFTLIANGPVTFMDNSSNTPFRWSWDFGDGNSSNEQNPVHEFDTTGTFNVCLTVENSAGSNQVCNMVSIITTSTRESTPLIALEVFPNPANQKIRIRTNETALRDAQLTIFNQNGQIMTRQVFLTDQEIITTGWPNGLYYYQLIKDGRLQSSGKLSIIR